MKEAAPKPKELVFSCHLEVWSFRPEAGEVIKPKTEQPIVWPRPRLNDSNVGLPQPGSAR